CWRFPPVSARDRLRAACSDRYARFCSRLQWSRLTSALPASLHHPCRYAPRSASFRRSTPQETARCTVGEAVRLAPFRAGSAHVVQLGTVRVENARCPRGEHRADALTDFTREGAEEG